MYRNLSCNLQWNTQLKKIYIYIINKKFCITQCKNSMPRSFYVKKKNNSSQFFLRRDSQFSIAIIGCFFFFSFYLRSPGSGNSDRGPCCTFSRSSPPGCLPRTPVAFAGSSSCASPSVVSRPDAASCTPAFCT